MIHERQQCQRTLSSTRAADSTTAQISHTTKGTCIDNGTHLQFVPFWLCNDDGWSNVSLALLQTLTRYSRVTMHEHSQQPTLDDMPDRCDPPRLAQPTSTAAASTPEYA